MATTAPLIGCNRPSVATSAIERAAAIESGTGSNVTDYVAQDGSKNIAVTADVADVDAMKSMLAAPPAEVIARMEAHGVVQPLTVYIES